MKEYRRLSPGGVLRFCKDNDLYTVDRCDFQSFIHTYCTKSNLTKKDIEHIAGDILKHSDTQCTLNDIANLMIYYNIIFSVFY